MKTRRYTDLEFIKAVSTSTSVRQVLKKIKVKPTGGNYRSFYSTANKLGVDTSHFKGQCWNKGHKGQFFRRPTKEYLSNKYPIQSHKLRLRLLRENIFPHKCFKCKNIKWEGEPIPLELEHIDGNYKNNSITNLCLLCPNCHAQTLTYRGKNKSKKT